MASLEQLLLSIASQIQARDSMFFSKFTHFNTHKKVESQVPQFRVAASSPTLAPAPAPVSKLSTQSGYGPFGPGSGLVVPKKSTTTAGDENDEFLDGEHDSESFNNNGFTTPNYNNNELYENQEKQGISDTRYLENGKYYYDLKNKKDYPGTESTQNQVNGYSRDQNNNGYRLASSQYETGSQTSNNDFTDNYNTNVYENGQKDTNYYAQVKENTQYQGNYFGSNEHPYEFNTVEEYEKQQGIVDLP
ncbi:hypothetical protein K2173_018637 [Erythroxylum novogranatense]|uniref:Uncharacterized protein n=1 Tax=Erythroxylum novogranatense TaxID=1862640 RepID=A0AAV8SAC2_9ROSI|nr:hypothetical protein K2173_018637 [Erythroxylum novogranatense]